MIAPNPFQPFFAEQGFLLLDGGLATALEARGHDLGDPLWSARVLLDAPDEVRAVHLEYLVAGADCITTVTYQASFPGFLARGLSIGDAERALRRAVELALEARDDFWAVAANRQGRLRPLVAASVGPYGAFLADGSEYTGRYDMAEDALVAWHRPRWRVLAGSAADVLACETIPALSEARALVRLFRETPDRPGWLSFQCSDGEHLADGTPVGEAVRACGREPALLAIGVNCVSPGRVDDLLSRAGAATDLPLLAYPNSGEVYDAATRGWTAPETVGDPVAMAPGWRARGARVLGGCCRTGPDTIRAMRRALSPA